METSFQKIKKRTSHNIPIANWSYKAYLLFHTETKNKHRVWQIKHLALIECRDFALISKRFFKVNSLTDLFENVKMEDVLSFLRKTGLYQKYDELKSFNTLEANEILII